MAPRCAIPILLGLGFLAVTGCGGTADGGSASANDAGRDGGDDAGMGASDDAAGTPDGSSLLAWPDGKYISVDEVYARSQAGDPEMLLVNVVDEEYYNLGHIAGSLKIPWDVLAGRLGELDSGRHIVVYCRKGVRSESAYTTLVDNAFPLAWVMEGGIERWIAAGYPTVAE
jgi:rhodanese-related sulfurtransferase